MGVGVEMVGGREGRQEGGREERLAGREGREGRTMDIRVHTYAPPTTTFRPLGGVGYENVCLYFVIYS